MTLSIGIDFGTSNTVVALARPDGQVQAITFDHRGAALRVYVTALCFWEDGQGASRRLKVEGGPFAIDRFLEGLTAQRFIQSFKTFAASASFTDTRIFRERFRFEDLLTSFMRTLLAHAGDDLDIAGSRVVVGRPVRFAGGRPDDALAMQRYHAAFDRLGASEALYVYEPVGAAFFFAKELEHDATVLVADFGGGTSDFSVLRFRRRDGVLRAEPLGHAGIGVAGDTFDFRLIDRVVSPHLGKGGGYRSMGGKVLAFPQHYHANFARWHQLALMKGSGDLKELRELARTALDPEPLERFIALIENDLGFALYRSVSGAKAALSEADQVGFRFAETSAGFEIEATITRADFEGWIAADVARIAATLDDALTRAAIGPESIDRIFLTGGSSFVPAIRRLFIERFGQERLISADQFESIAYGLALIGQAPDRERWAARGSA